MIFCREDSTGVLLHLHVIPNARKTEIIGIHGECLKIKIQAPPVDGKANDEIIRFFSKLLKIPKARIYFENGETSKSKILRCENLQAESLSLILKEFLSPL